MATEQQKSPKHRHISRRRLATAVIALLLLVSAALFWVLNAQGVIRGSWSSVLAIAFTVLGVIFTFRQGAFHPLRELEETEQEPEASVESTQEVREA